MQSPESRIDCERHSAQLVFECEGSLGAQERSEQQAHRELCADCRVEFDLATIVENAGRRARVGDDRIPGVPQSDFAARVLADWRSHRSQDSHLIAPGSPCPDVLPSLTAWIEGDLSPADRTPIERHLAACDACATYLTDARRCDLVLAHWRAPEPTTSLREHVLDQIRESVAAARRARPVLRLAPRIARGLAAAAVLLFSTLALRSGLGDLPQPAASPSPTLRPSVVKNAMQSLAKKRELMMRAVLDEVQPNGIGSANAADVVPARSAFSMRRSNNAWHLSVQRAILKETEDRTR